jgi:choline transporter-like protein 2/4/5
LFNIQIVFIIAYAVATLFMAVYSVAMDTLLACFIIDENNQKAKGGKAPLYAPE